MPNPNGEPTLERQTDEKTRNEATKTVRNFLKLTEIVAQKRREPADPSSREYWNHFWQTIRMPTENPTKLHEAVCRDLSRSLEVLNNGERDNKPEEYQKIKEFFHLPDDQPQLTKEDINDLTQGKGTAHMREKERITEEHDKAEKHRAEEAERIRKASEAAAEAKRREEDESAKKTQSEQTPNQGMTEDETTAETARKAAEARKAEAEKRRKESEKQEILLKEKLLKIEKEIQSMWDKEFWSVAPTDINTKNLRRRALKIGINFIYRISVKNNIDTKTYVRCAGNVLAKNLCKIPETAINFDSNKRRSYLIDTRYKSQVRDFSADVGTNNRDDPYNLTYFAERDNRPIGRILVLGIDSSDRDFKEKVNKRAKLLKFALHPDSLNSDLKPIKTVLSQFVNSGIQEFVYPFLEPN